MTTAFRLSGSPVAVPVSAKIALANAFGTGPFSAAKSATPGAAAGAAPSLWGSIAHGAELSANPLNVSAWALDPADGGTTEEVVAADSPYTAPRRVISALNYGRKNTTTSALTVGVGYPFVAVIKAGTSDAARIVIREAASQGEARVLTTGFASVSVTYSTTSIGTITVAAVEALGDGWYRLSGVFTPAIATTYSFGVGPNPASGVSGDVSVYGGALAEPDGPAPDPDPETVPAPFAPEQWELLDAGADGATLIVRILELPYDGGRPLTAIGYRLNGSGATVTFPTIAPGDYQITVPSETEASVLLRAVNALGGVSSLPKTETPSAGTPPDPGEADLVVASNDFLEVQDYFDVDSPTTVMTRLDGNVLSTDGWGNSYQRGNGSILYTNGRGDLYFHPNGAYDYLDPGAFVDVPITYRRTGDGSDQTVTIRVTGSAETGDDLAAGVTPSTAMTLTETVAVDKVLEVAFTAGGSACTPSLGGAGGGKSVPAGKRDVQYLRAPSGGSAALTFTTTPSAVHAREVLTPGDAATIRKLKASRSGTTLTLAWGVTPKAGLPATSGWTSRENLSFSNTLDALAFRAQPTTRLYVNNCVFNTTRRWVVMDGYTGFFALDCEGFGAQSLSTTYGSSFGLTEGDDPALGPAYFYDCKADRNTPGSADGDGKINTDIWDGDAFTEIDAATVRQRPDNKAFYILGCEARNVGDAPLDMKIPWWGNMITVGGSWRHWRQWTHPGVISRAKSDSAPVNLYMQTVLRAGFLDFFMWELADGSKFYEAADASRTWGVSFWTNKVTDGRAAGADFHFIARKAKPKLPPEVDVAATDFEFEQSLNGGASWSSLAVARTGTNDCWGATRRTVTGVSTSITHVRARARWGDKIGEWTQAAVTA